MNNTKKSESTILYTFTGVCWFTAVLELFTLLLLLRGETGFKLSKVKVPAEEVVNQIEAEEDKGPVYSDVLGQELAAFIEMECQELGVNSSLAVAILLTENTSLEPMSVNQNRDGSKDLGLWQLNTSSLYNKGGFIDLFWDKDRPFNPYSVEDSTYIALRYIRDLQRSFDSNIERVAAAYNCGAGRVWQDRIPASTSRQYVPKVKSRYDLLMVYQKQG